MKSEYEVSRFISLKRHLINRLLIINAILAKNEDKISMNFQLKIEYHS